jgi:hypothetical protein
MTRLSARHPRGAFTLLELAIAAAVAAIVFGAALALLASAHRTVESSGQRLARREAARAALARLRMHLTDATSISTIDESRIGFETPVGLGELRADRARRLLELRAPGARRPEPIAAGVDELLIEEPRPGIVRVRLALTGARVGGRTSPELILEDEILVPARLAAAPALPLRPELAGSRAYSDGGASPLATAAP